MSDLTSGSNQALSGLEIFCSPKCSKFTVECDWNSKISHNVQNLFCFGKKLNLFEIAKGGKFAVERVSKDIISWNVFSSIIVSFLTKSLNFSEVEKIGKFYGEGEYFEEERFHFLKRHEHFSTYEMQQQQLISPQLDFFDQFLLLSCPFLVLEKFSNFFLHTKTRQKLLEGKELKTLCLCLNCDTAETKKEITVLLGSMDKMR